MLRVWWQWHTASSICERVPTCHSLGVGFRMNQSGNFKTTRRRRRKKGFRAARVCE
jgi:hypothetical protein